MKIKFWNDKVFVSRSFEFENDTLWYVRGPQFRNALIPLTENKFQMKLPTEDKIYFTFDSKNGEKYYTLNNGDSDPSNSFAYVPNNLDAGELEAFEGTFWNS